MKIAAFWENRVQNPEKIGKNLAKIQQNSGIIIFHFLIFFVKNYNQQKFQQFLTKKLRLEDPVPSM